MVFAVVERPCFAEIVAAFEHFAVGGGGFGRGRLKNRNRVRAYYTYPTAGLKVLCGLRLATYATSKLEVSHRLKPVSC